MTAFWILTALLWLAALAVIWITAAAEDLDRDIARVLSEPLPDPSAPDEDFDAWAQKALGIAPRGDR